MTTGSPGGRALEWTGERYVPEISGNIRLEHVHRYLLARELSKDVRVLDIACGEGFGSDLLAQTAARVTGVDIVPEVVLHAGRRYRRNNLGFIAGSCAAIPMADQSVDVVVSFETLEHHDQHDEMMREVRRVLRPGGVLVISSPDRREYSDLPAYQNPFHVRELYRDEFEGLLKGHFRHVGVVGQRIRAGSVIGPMETTANTGFISFDNSDSADRRVEGMLAPLYFIAVATDGPLPRVPTGVLDGGEFVWSGDHVQVVRAKEEQFAHATTVHESTTTVLKAEIDRQTATITAVAAEKGRAEERSAHFEERSAHFEERSAHFEERSAHFEEEAERRGRQIETIETAKAQLQGLANDAHVALEDARAQLRAARQEIDVLTSAIATRDGALGQLEQRLRRLEQREEQAKAVETELHKKIDFLEHSHSWRLTSPLRTSRRAASRTPALVRKTISDSARSLYAGLPLPQAVKLGLKHAIFRAAPFAVRHTVAYRAWQDQKKPRAAGVPDPPAAVAALSPEPARPAPISVFEQAPIEYVPITSTPSVDTRIKAIAFYLPQFHPIPENDRWWGKGFTEWHNVARGRSQFAGHYQPHLPGELGFYDLRLLEIQRRQIELAKMYGLHGFCYHHYWFGGTRLLRQPLDQLLANADLDFPFCLCWANENWTRRWDGLDDEILIAQQHSPEDDLAFIEDIEPALRDPRYIRLDGRPLLIVYRPALLPNAKETAARWRSYCRDRGLGDPFLVSTQAFDRCNPHEFGFDAAVEFAPNNMDAPKITSQVPLVNPEFHGDIYDYRYLVEYSRRYQRPADYRLYRSVTPMWDNEARRPGRGAVFAHASPALFGEWLENACRYTAEHFASDRSFVFVNAWNEWAEGAHLEPDRSYGYAFLQTTADTLRKFPSVRSRPSIVVVSHDAHFHGAQHTALHLAKTLSNSLGYDVEILLCGDGILRRDFEAVGPVHDFSPVTTTREARERIVQEVYDRGARIALANTSVVGESVELLKAAGFAVVSLVHELPGLIRAYGLETSIATIARDADYVVFAANVIRDQFQQLTGLAPEKSVIRPQGLLAHNHYSGRLADAKREVRGRLGLPATTRIVLGVGYADYRKGLDLFVEVGLQLAERVQDMTFVWVGHHDAQAFSGAMARITEAGLESLFLFPGLVEEPDIFFAGSDVFLLTSREDPFPSVVLEALDARIPVIGFEGAGGFVELLARGCGVLVPYLDTGAMTDALHRLVDNPDEQHRLGARGHEIVAREFSWIDYTRDVVGLVAPPRPKVAVVVPNYNYAHHLPTRLRSIMRQTYPPHEIIFLDDCSSDQSVEVAEATLREGNIPFRIIRNDVNQGCYRQWLAGISAATGDLVWMAEADDDCAPTLLETLVPAFERKSVVLAYCQSTQIDEMGRTIAPNYLEWTADVSPTKWQQAYVRSGVDEICDSLIVKNTIPNVSAVLMRKPDLSAIRSQLVTMRNAGDWLVYVHLLERGDLAYFPDALNCHRRHGGSVTIGDGGVNLMRENLLIQQYILERHGIRPDIESKREACLQKTYEYLKLDADGPRSYRDHEVLKDALPTVAG
jgi:glycosyltransferase involved in cell wall biosynthesis/SAM-dependent methyltransferase